LHLDTRATIFVKIRSSFTHPAKLYSTIESPNREISCHAFASLVFKLFMTIYVEIDEEEQKKKEFGYVLKKLQEDGT
jgi:hypothetical protein